jgi:hypothetical protein
MTTPIGSYNLPPAGLPSRVNSVGSNVADAGKASSSSSADFGPAYTVELSGASEVSESAGSVDHAANITNHANAILGALDAGYGSMLTSARAAAAR